MRLLALTAFYPPLGYGYGAMCSDVMESLAARGHDVTVLCAEGDPGEGVDVRSGLGHVPAAWRRPVAGLRGEAASQRLTRTARDQGVDVAVAWHMRGIGKGSLELLHAAGIPVVYMFGDLWGLYEKPGLPGWWKAWNALDRHPGYARLRQGAGALGRPLGLDLRQPPISTDGHCVFSSRWLLEQYAAGGLRPHRAHVIPNGIRTERFTPGERGARDEPLLAFAGRTDRSKGADLAVRALAEIPRGRLVLAGDSGPAEREALVALIAELGLGDRVELRGLQPRHAVAGLLEAADVFLMPGRVEEGFGLAYLEAMAAGAAVVGTARGGAAELCADGENALVVGADPGEVASAVSRLLGEPGLREQIVAGGLRTAAEHDLGRMVDRVEELIVSVSP